MRRATTADAEPLAAFNADVLRPQDSVEPASNLAIWTRDLLSGSHPTFTPDDALVVEDTRSGAIVSSTVVVWQTWSLGGIRVDVGQIELAGTHPAFRGRGLVRAMVETIHDWSVARRAKLTAISGIPFFYRQFGYEMALPRGGGPELPMRVSGPAAPSPYRVREMRAGDLPFVVETDTHAASRYLVTVPRTRALWRYDLEGHTRGSGVRLEHRIVETRDGEPLGFLSHIPVLIGGALGVTAIELKPETSWPAAWRAVAAYLEETGHAYAERDARTFRAINFWMLGDTHPLYRTTRMPVALRGYAWYVRVVDLPELLRAITPVLEQRLAESPFVGHTGDVRLSFYRDGVQLVFEHGRLKAVDAWRPPTSLVGQENGAPSDDPRRPIAMFPGLTFLQVLFGYRTLAELQAAFPDVIVRTPEAQALVEALFPKAPSAIWAIL